VVFSSAADNLEAGDTNNVANIFGSTISATEMSSISFPTAPITVTRHFGVLPIYLTRSGPLSQPASVRVYYSSPDGSVSGFEFGLVSGVVTFNAGQASAPVLAYIPDAINGLSPLTGTIHLWLWDPLTATLGTPDSYDFTIMNVLPGPMSGLSATNNSPTVLGNPTTLTASVAGPYYANFNWSFGDATVGYGGSIVHTYAALGVYTATVTATNGGFTNTLSTRVTVVTAILHKLYLPLIKR
jgi:PKD repeat protein